MLDRRVFVRSTLAASALAALCGCAGPGSKDDHQPPEEEAPIAREDAVLRFHILNPISIDPYDAQDSEGMQVVHQLFDPLTTYDWDAGALVGKAAVDWEANDDLDVFVFHLVEGATFHNGEAVDAESFKRGWERICDPRMNPPSSIRYHLDPVVGSKEMANGSATELAGVEVVDKYTLRVSLTAPMADFPYVCAHPALVPVPQAALDDPASFLMKPIGNGPFMMEEPWVIDQYVRLKRFDGYYGDLASLGGVNFSISQSNHIGFQEFEAGHLDFTPIAKGRFGEMRDNYGLSQDGYTITPEGRVLTGPECSIYYLAVNCQDKAMKDVRVRRALSLAINRQRISDEIFGGTFPVADRMIPPAIDDDPSGGWDCCRYDVEAARELLDESYPSDDEGMRGLEVTLVYSTGGGHDDIMKRVANDLRDVGVGVRMDSLEWAASIGKLTDGRFQLGRMGWFADYPTMDNFLYPNFFSSSRNNYSHYTNDEVDKALEDARSISDEEERKEAYRRIHHLIGRDVPAIPLLFYSHNHIGSGKIIRLYDDPQGMAHLANALMT